MKRNAFKLSLIATSIATLLSPASHAEISGNTFHTDFRDSVKIDFYPTSTNQKSISSKEHALQFLKRNKEKYALETNIDDLRLSKVKSSLTAEHYYFQQFISGVEVDKGEIIVSVSKQNKVIRVFNNTFPVAERQSKAQAASIGEKVATETAWNYLQVSGKLHAPPPNRLVYMNVGVNFTLAYKVNMSTSAPQGDWEFYIDAQKGDVLRAYRIDLPISKNANERDSGRKWDAFPKNKNHRLLSDALSNLAPTHKLTAINAAKIDAAGLVFDPDPRTTLNNSTLEDNSPAASFDAAYLNKILRDVEFNGLTYSLTGPWVTIEDWQAPVTAPSTNTTGIWNAKRGGNAFNDAMTYYHLDQNQRYMQSLGFMNATGIQFGSIHVDTDGHNGGDQSSFTPSINKLSFGHGCVDDNEDADVILHEYSHAINSSINPSWGGGDTGAMGEGFGDYWAFSYSYSTPNGQSFYPEWVFSWDAHGDSNSCWEGRQVDRTAFRYDSTKSYGAHVRINGQNGDELWSTPLAQSLIQLMNAGVSRSEVDQIILEAQFGLGFGLKMSDMAATIVSTANRLFPAGQHAAVFDNNFKMMNILSDSLEAQAVSVISSGGDAIVSPGEMVSFNIPLKNKSGATISQISTTLSTSTGGVAFGSASSNYPDLMNSATINNQTPFELSIPVAHACGNDIAISMSINYTEESAKSTLFSVVFPVGGSSTVVTQASSPGVLIPDSNTIGVTDRLTVSGAATDSTISVEMNITHTYSGDLIVILTSPAGTSVTLHNRTGGSSNNVIGNYPENLTPAGSLSAFDGEDHNGIWSLKIVDGAGLDIGTLNSWSVMSTSPSLCPTPTNIAPVASVASSAVMVTEGNNILLDASGSSDANGDVLTYTWLQTSGPNVTLMNTNTAQASFIAPSVTALTILIFDVTVSDSGGASDTGTVTVTVNDSATAVPTPAVGGGGGGLGWLTLGLLALRRFSKNNN